MEELKKKNLSRIVIVHLNINSIRNKFEVLSGGMEGNVDISVISETKIDDSFPTGQFTMESFATLCRLKRNCFSDGIMAYAREDISLIYLPLESLNIEGFCIEINLRKMKWHYNRLRNNI